MGGAAQKAGLVRAARALAEALQEADVEFAFIGGLAVLVHGHPRTTFDVDAVAIWLPSDLKTLLPILARHGIRPRVPDVEALAERTLVALLVHSPTGVELDVSFGVQTFEHEAIARATSVRWLGPGLKVIPLEELLVYKLIASRPKDLEDVEALLCVATRVDRERVERSLGAFDEVLETDHAGQWRQLARRLLGPTLRRPSRR